MFAQPQVPARRPASTPFALAFALALLHHSASAFGLDDVTEQARALSRTPNRTDAATLSAALQGLDYDEYRNVQAETIGVARRGAALRAAVLPRRPRLHARAAPRRAGRRQAAALADRPRCLRLQPAEAPAVEPRHRRRRGLSRALPDGAHGLQGRDHRLPRRQLLPRSGRGPALWPLGARAGGGHRGRQRRGIPRLHDDLVRAPGARRRNVDAVCAARRPARHRRLPLRHHAGKEHHHRRAGARLPARTGGDAGPRAADEHVPRRREPAAG